MNAQSHKFTVTINSDVNPDLHAELEKMKRSSRPGRMVFLAAIGQMYLNNQMEVIEPRPVRESASSGVNIEPETASLFDDDDLDIVSIMHDSLSSLTG